MGTIKTFFVSLFTSLLVVCGVGAGGIWFVKNNPSVMPQAAQNGLPQLNLGDAAESKKNQQLITAMNVRVESVEKAHKNLIGQLNQVLSEMNTKISSADQIAAEAKVSSQQALKTAAEKANEKPQQPVRDRKLLLVDMSRVMRDSLPGKAITQYMKDYAENVDKAVKNLALVRQRSKDPVQSASTISDQRYLVSELNRIEESMKKHLFRIAAQAITKNLRVADAIIADSSSIVLGYSARDVDITDEVIKFMTQEFVPQLPKVPEINIQVPPEPKPAPAKAKGRHK